MKTKASIESEELIREIARYLEAVDAYRAEHCEPKWLVEAAPGGPVQKGVQ